MFTFFSSPLARRLSLRGEVPKLIGKFSKVYWPKVESDEITLQLVQLQVNGRLVWCRGGPGGPGFGRCKTVRGHSGFKRSTELRFMIEHRGVIGHTIMP